MNKGITSDTPRVFTYNTLREVIGLLGVALPFIVSLGAMLFFHEGIQSSISAYYYTGMRDVLVGTLWAIGFFMLSYQGYENADRNAGIVVCISAVGIALFPTTPEKNPSPSAHTIGIFHYVFAALFFLSLIYTCFFLFTKTKIDRPPTRKKIQRNKVYRICGAVMIVCILLIALFSLLPDQVSSSLEFTHPVFWLETIAILAFGFSWITKGEAILKDEENDLAGSAANLQ
jgi:magnesium-transporting ATPase (P-type)